MLRPAPHDTPQRAEVQWRGAGAAAFTTLARVSVQNPTGALTANVSVPGAGALRIAWRAPDGQRYYSRSVGLQGR
jgi:hypothetical protein